MTWLEEQHLQPATFLVIQLMFLRAPNKPSAASVPFAATPNLSDGIGALSVQQNQFETAEEEGHPD